MERWRIFGLATLLAVLFLACLFLVSETGRARMQAAAEDMQHAMARRILVGELRGRVADVALAYGSYLVSGRPDTLEPLRNAGPHINEIADSLVASYKGEPGSIDATAHQLRYLAGVVTGAMATTITLYASRGPEAALALARAQDPRADPVQQFLGVADQLERYESARMRETRANWQRETLIVRRLAAIATVANILLVVSAMLMAKATLRRHRELTQQTARRRDELEVQADARATELNEVYGHLQTVQEQERSRLARGLHDELGGLLLAAHMDATWLTQHLHDASAEDRQMRLRRIQDVLNQGIDLKRRVIEELRPTLLDNMGLIAALRWQLDETCGRSGLKCTAHFPAEDPLLDPRTAIAIFRVVQEALTNVHKHASGASRVDVTLEVSAAHILLVISDDGAGIAPSALGKPQSHGLAGMKHRVAAVGGTLRIGRSTEGGAEITALMPRQARAASAA
jgi:signal transduction histidine kinase